MTTENDRAPDEEERLVALLALHAGKPPAVQDRPSDQQITAFIEGRLEGAERAAMLARLNSSPNLYHEWLETAAALEDAQSADTRSMHSNSGADKGGWLASLRCTITQWSTPLRFAIPAAAAATLLVGIWSTSPPELQERVDQQLATATSMGGDRLGEASQALLLPWEIDRLGFAPSAAPPESEAFASGLWAARRSLSPQSVEHSPEPFTSADGGRWSDTDWAAHYELGRWSALLWIESRAQMVGVDWSMHQRALEALTGELASQTGAAASRQETLGALQRIEPLLVEVVRDPTPSALARLNRGLTMLIHRMAP